MSEGVGSSDQPIVLSGDSSGSSSSDSPFYSSVSSSSPSCSDSSNSSSSSESVSSESDIWSDLEAKLHPKSLQRRKGFRPKRKKGETEGESSNQPSSSSVVKSKSRKVNMNKFKWYRDKVNKVRKRLKLGRFKKS